MKIHILQHVPFEGPGHILKWASEHGIELSYTLFFETVYQLPEIDQIDAVIIMGGPMSVYDESQYQWLLPEKAFIRGCILAGKKILGICLGAQLASICLGAGVYSASHKEIGWQQVQAIAQHSAGNWLSKLFEESPAVFHWHGESFDIPQGARDLLVSAANNHQAYLYQDKVLALQFHLEATRETIADLLLHCSADLIPSAYVQSAEEIKARLSSVPLINKLMEKILSRFFLNQSSD